MSAVDPRGVLPHVSKHQRRHRRPNDLILILCAVFLGSVPRLVWAIRQIGIPGLNLGEAHNGAVGLALNGMISSVYRPPNTVYPPDGLPTAHLLPIPVSIAAGVYHLFGIDTPAATVVLTLLAVAVTMAGYVLFFYAFAALGMSRGARLTALFALCLIPLNIHLETEDFRFWEGGYAVMVAAALLLTLVTLHGRVAITWTEIFGLVLLNALLFFISPQLGVAGYVCLGLLALRRIPPRRWFGTGALAAIALGIFIVPWTIRNEALLGKPILLRSNLGLELALAFHPAAVEGDGRTTFEQRYTDIHPNVTDKAYAKMRAAGGEDPYAEQLGQTAKAWMNSHPQDVVRLGMRHLIEYAFPPSWVLQIFSSDPLRPRDYFWLAMTWFYSFAGLAGCVYAVLRLDSRYQYGVILLVVSALPFALVQPVTRYHFIMYDLSVFFSFVLLDRLATAAAWLRHRVV
ncbi:hypothetical protein P7D22_14615 [Lichenihabitans sp. Uapishka_5]|uniref:hypothetical protein n=1 Tax=Lichenihabitans sp. Uapishka_5 TaxID=3037302 RepID=UPI0029E7DF0B|nr:hypothetical protein [Lichenihabitans sp. Uapishka_5]MDX7952401.1 hypothetical protein [Lichenihabitans sp. Uapishka_5]